MLTTRLKYYDYGFKIGPLTFITPEMVARYFKEAVANYDSLKCVEILDLMNIQSLKECLENKHPIAETLLSQVEPEDILKAIEFILDGYAESRIFANSISRVGVLPRFKETVSEELLKTIRCELKKLPKTEWEHIPGFLLKPSYDRTPSITVNYHETKGITVDAEWMRNQKPIQLKERWDKAQDEMGSSILWPTLVNHFKTIANDSKKPEWQSKMAREEYLKLGYKDLEAV